MTFSFNRNTLKKTIQVLLLPKSKCPWVKKGVLWEDRWGLEHSGQRWHLPGDHGLHSLTSAHTSPDLSSFFLLDVIFTGRQILICSIKCAWFALSLPWTFVCILFSNLLGLLLYFLSRIIPVWQIRNSHLPFWPKREHLNSLVQLSTKLCSVPVKACQQFVCFQIMFILGPYGKSSVCIWKYFVFCLCLRYCKCSVQTHIWENKQYWCCLWQRTYSHIKNIF